MLHITDEGRALIRQALGASLYKRAAPITLAGPPVSEPAGKKSRQLRRQRFDRMVNNAEAILRTGRPTYFEFEGACIAGFRTALVLEGGWYWDDADRAARGVVETALSRIGAERPTFDQAQPEVIYEGLIERTRCIRCGHGIPEDRYTNGKVAKFCSDRCSKNDSAERARLSHGARNWSEWLAFAAVQKNDNLINKRRDCIQCGKVFISIHREQVFCSLACKGQNSAVHQVRPCETCGKEFQTRASRAAGGVSKFCSKPCAVTATWEKRRQTMACDDLGRVQMVPREERSCVVCSTIFRPKRASDPKSTCSVPCRYRLRSQTRWGVPA